MNYTNERLGKYIDILSGYAFKSTDFSDKGIPVVKIKNICPPDVLLIDLSYVPKDVAEKQSKYLLSYGDVLIALTGSHVNQIASVVGRVATVKYRTPSLLNQRVGKVVIVDEANCDLNYVYYFLSQEKVKLQLASNAGGAANQANISPSDIKNLLVPFPDITVQRRISGILSAYDKLIENNQKQIRLLGEAAQRLYKEWFVDLHFPGYESVKVNDGEPECWEKSKAEKFYDITIGKTPPRAEKQWFTTENNGIKWVSIADMGKSATFISNTAEALTLDAIERHNIKIIPANTILLSFKLTVGRVAITTEQMCTNEAIAHLRINESIQREYLYLYLRNFNYDSLGNTSAISKAINSKIVKSMPIMMPDEIVLKMFSANVKPLFDMMENLQRSIMNLSQARDRLLPKLMSGEIKV